jgi:hypothetical protein
MDLKIFAALPLIFLGAAAAPQGDCGAGLGGGGPALPAPVDLSGRPSAPSGLSGQVYAALPAPEVAAGCRSPLPSTAQPSSLHSDSADVLHGLPSPEILLPINEPKRAPLIAR